jgi:hypothetical protein
VIQFFASASVAKSLTCISGRSGNVLALPDLAIDLLRALVAVVGTEKLHGSCRRRRRATRRRAAAEPRPDPRKLFRRRWTAAS